MPSQPHVGPSTPDDLRNGCDRNGFRLFCRSGLLLICLASAAGLHKFAEPIFGLEADRPVSDDYRACDTNQIVVVNRRTLEIIGVTGA
jgi:hypothetical protein